MDSERVFVAMYSDRPTAEALRELARRETDGNVSMCLRRIVRESAERAGVVIAESRGGAPDAKQGR